MVVSHSLTLLVRVWLHETTDMEPMEMVSSSSSSASNDDNDKLLNDLFPKKLCMLLRMYQNATQNT